MTPARPGLAHRIRSIIDVFWRELAKFGVVGAIAFLIDFGGFHLLFYGPLQGHLTTAKVLSGAVATSFAWVGNRLWTFRHRRNRPVHHEALLFFVVNGVGLVIATGWLNFSHDVLDMTSRSAVSVNTVVGIALATVFRFWAYRQVVFAGERPGDAEPAEQDAPEQARPEQNRPEQTRLEQTRFEQARLEQARPEQTRPEQARVQQAPFVGEPLVSEPLVGEPLVSEPRSAR